MEKKKILMVSHPSLDPRQRRPKGVAPMDLDWKTERDVWNALKHLEHEVEFCGIEDDLSGLRARLVDFSPDVVFNLIEEFRGEATLDFVLPAELEAAGVKYTGCHPAGLVLARNKVHCKKIVAYHGIPTPGFFLEEELLDSSTRKSARWPLILKYIREDASLGLTQANVVENWKDAKTQWQRLRENHPAEVFAEEFIPGIDCTVAILGNQKTTVFPPWQISLPSHSHIASERVKWDSRFRHKNNIRAGRCRVLDKHQEERIQSAAQEIYSVLGLSGLARIDFRISEKDGEIFFLEANPNPNIAKNEDVADSAKARGWSYPQLIQSLLELSERRSLVQ